MSERDDRQPAPYGRASEGPPPQRKDPIWSTVLIWAMICATTIAIVWILHD